MLSSPFQFGGEGAADVLIDCGCIEALADALSAAALPVLDGLDEGGHEGDALLASLHALCNHFGAQGALQPLARASVLDILIRLTSCDATQERATPICKFSVVTKSS